MVRAETRVKNPVRMIGFTEGAGDGEKSIEFVGSGEGPDAAGAPKLVGFASTHG